MEMDVFASSGAPVEAVGGGSLSDDVREELVAAGLPVVPPEREGRSVGGASVIDASDNAGVWIDWIVSGALSDASVRAMEVGAWQPDGSSMHPAIRQSGTVKFTMRGAMAAILTEAGFDVDLDADDLQPTTLLVRSRRPGPTWRSPAGPLAGASGYSPGIRVCLIDGEFAGAVTTVVSAHWEDRWPDGAPDRYRVQHPHGTSSLEVPATSVALAADPPEGLGDPTVVKT
ncbi:hypothetical protein GCM10009557_06250 [Virgisporangium ochraceum]|uniref:Uncharacterized protein n=1 Tax=Virgisporangium ochraceum TaxID=65505 RepID=A0A8J4A3P8_9ACTN|nr:hypothetical protein Voc01_101740 [Virgisporangium ochraceum]